MPTAAGCHRSLAIKQAFKQAFELFGDGLQGSSVVRSCCSEELREHLYRGSVVSSFSRDLLVKLGQNSGRMVAICLCKLSKVLATSAACLLSSSQAWCLLGFCGENRQNLFSLGG